MANFFDMLRCPLCDTWYEPHMDGGTCERCKQAALTSELEENDYLGQIVDIVI